jgi:hypothetical protein
VRAQLTTSADRRFTPGGEGTSEELQAEATRLETADDIPKPVLCTSVYQETFKQLGVEVEMSQDEADDRLMELVSRARRSVHYTLVVQRAYLCCCVVRVLSYGDGGCAAPRYTRAWRLRYCLTIRTSPWRRTA